MVQQALQEGSWVGQQRALQAVHTALEFAIPAWGLARPVLGGTVRPDDGPCGQCTQRLNLQAQHGAWQGQYDWGGKKCVLMNE